MFMPSQPRTKRSSNPLLPKFLLPCLLLLTLQIQAKADAPMPVGTIDTFSGTVKLRSFNGNKETTLRLKLDFGKKLYGRDQLTLSDGAKLQYTIGGRPSSLIGPITSYPIPQPHGVDDLYTRSMRLYARIGGRKRGGERQIYQPAPDSVALAEGFSIRWTPEPLVKEATATITVGSNQIWTSAVDASTGLFKGQELENRDSRRPSQRIHSK